MKNPLVVKTMGTPRSFSSRRRRKRRMQDRVSKRVSICRAHDLENSERRTKGHRWCFTTVTCPHMTKDKSTGSIDADAMPLTCVDSLEVHGLPKLFPLLMHQEKNEGRPFGSRQPKLSSRPNSNSKHDQRWCSYRCQHVRKTQRTQFCPHRTEKNTKQDYLPFPFPFPFP